MDCPSTWARSRCSNAAAILPFSSDLSAQISSASICSLSFSIPNDCKPRLGPGPRSSFLPTASFFAVNASKRKFQLLLEGTSSKTRRSGIAQTDVPTIDETDSFPFPYSLTLRDAVQVSAERTFCNAQITIYKCVSWQPKPSRSVWAVT